MDKNNQVLVSIIVPVYRVEKYLKRCLESLVNQTYENIEIILIDDGSPDNSGAICDEYSQIDTRVKVIHKDNGGLSEARNNGIEAAIGEFILFVDSDDYIELNTIEKLLFCAKENNLEVVCGNALRIESCKSPVIKTVLLGGNFDYKIRTGADYLCDCINRRKLYVAVWVRMYSTELVKKNNIYFTKHLLHEDEEWTPLILLKAKKVGYINFTFYNYIIRENSITQTFGDENIYAILNICKKLENLYNSLSISETNNRLLKDYIARLYINTCTYCSYNKKTYNAIIDKRFPLRNSFYFTTKIRALVFFLSIAMYKQISKYLKSLLQSFLVYLLLISF